MEVKTGHLCKNAVLFGPTGHAEDKRRSRQESDEPTKHFDILAVALLAQKEVIYNPEPEDWGKKECTLRRSQRSIPHSGKPCRRVKHCEALNGKLHIEFEQDGMSMEMMLKDFPELAQLSDDEVKKTVIRNGYWLRWPCLNFEINVTDFLRLVPREVQEREVPVAALACAG